MKQEKAMARIWLEEGVPFRENRLLQLLLILYALSWIVLAIHPYNRFDWLLENLLIFLTLGGLLMTYRIFIFNNLSYLLMMVFLLLHTIGAHYSYNTTPVDIFLSRMFHFSRDNYDRVVHFSFGLLMVYPLREFVQRVMKIRTNWSYLISALIILAFGAFYELIEMWVAEIVAPEIGTLFLGTQGDIWDTQHDMEVALYGAAITMSITYVVNQWTGSRYTERAR